MSAAAYFAATVYGDLSELNCLIWQFTNVFTDLKFTAIFSMLFGASIVLMTSRHEAHSQSSAGSHYQQMAWLIVPIIVFLLTVRLQLAFPLGFSLAIGSAYWAIWLEWAL